jgi:hypothetical protein
MTAIDRQPTGILLTLIMLMKELGECLDGRL